VCFQDFAIEFRHGDGADFEGKEANVKGLQQVFA